MKRLVSAFLLAVGIAAPALAQNKEQKPAPKTSVTAITGLRNDGLRWNIAGDMMGEYTPNILSELTWKNVRSFDVGAHFTHNVPLKIFPLAGSMRVEAEVVQGSTFAGKNQDSDYNGDFRTQEFSRSNNNASGGSSLNSTVAVGFTVNTPSFSVAGVKVPSVSITPLTGYTWSSQVFKMTDGYQTVPEKYKGPFDGLDASYTANWNGRFIGVESGLVKGRHALNLRNEYHWLNYNGAGVWNLRDDLMQDPSFTHTANGAAIRAKVGYAFSLTANSQLTVAFARSLRVAYNGVDKVYLREPSDPTFGYIIQTRVNEVRSTAQSLAVGYKISW